MLDNSGVRRALRGIIVGAGLATITYASYVGIAWYRYGRAARPTSDEEKDALLDRFMPEYDVAERHAVRVAAPAEFTLSAAKQSDLQSSTIIRGIFKARSLFLGARPDDTTQPRGLIAQVTSLGWGVLAEIPGREIVVGAVTQPWVGDPVFRAVAPDQFVAFREPGYVKIAWTLRAEPISPAESIFRTETRVTTTDSAARARFRWYWARFSAGILLIRRLSLGIVKTEAERRAQRGRATPRSA
jgi:hypothetical protein